MQKLDVKLIALDLDDTLLDNNRGISDANVEALQECAKRGIYIVLCSGRAENAILPFVRRLEIAGMEQGRYLIAINGCSIFDMHKRNQIFCSKVDSSLLLRVNQIAEEYGLKSEVYTPDTIYYNKCTEWTKLDVDLCGLKGQEVEDYENLLRQGFTKMLVPGDPELLQTLQKQLKDELGSKAVIFTSKPYFLEILPPACGKGEAVSYLAKHIGIPVEKTMGFGDSMNDESMFKLCGYGIAMQNALPYIKSIASYVTRLDNNNSGIADFLREYVL